MVDIMGLLTWAGLVFGVDVKELVDQIYLAGNILVIGFIPINH